VSGQAKTAAAHAAHPRRCADTTASPDRTAGFERELDRTYTRRTKAQLWELPRSAHTHGLEDHARGYAKRVLALFDQALR
jgi:phage gp46-like protein